MSRVTVWRLCSADYAATAFSGTGARLYGGRWSPPGAAVVYCSESRALAALEILVHVDDPVRLTARTWVCISASFSTEFVEKPARVPATWRNYPYSPDTQAFGAAWVREARSAVLRIPSAVVPGEFNFLINPAHPDFAHVTLGGAETFTFDPRFVP